MAAQLENSIEHELLVFRALDINITRAYFVKRFVYRNACGLGPTITATRVFSRATHNWCAINFLHYPSRISTALLICSVFQTSRPQTKHPSRRFAQLVCRLNRHDEYIWNCCGFVSRAHREMDLINTYASSAMTLSKSSTSSTASRSSYASMIKYISTLQVGFRLIRFRHSADVRPIDSNATNKLESRDRFWLPAKVFFKAS